MSKPSDKFVVEFKFDAAIEPYGHGWADDPGKQLRDEKDLHARLGRKLKRPRGSPSGVRADARGRLWASEVQARIAEGVTPFAAIKLVADKHSVDKKKVKKAHYQYPNNSDN